MRLYIKLASLAGALGVATGAFGAHALKPRLIETAMLATWNTAVLYHLLHTVALLAIGLHGSKERPAARWLGWSGACWVAGIVLFSGSLYGLALGGPRFLGPITPLGGVFFILGWLCLLGATPRKTT